MKEKIVSLVEKFLDLLSSPRFIGVLLIGIIQALVVFNVITGVQAESLAHIIQTVTGAAVLIGTVDRNIGDAKIIASGVKTTKKNKKA